MARKTSSSTLNEVESPQSMGRKNTTSTAASITYFIAEIRVRLRSQGGRRAEEIAVFMLSFPPLSANDRM